MQILGVRVFVYKLVQKYGRDEVWEIYVAFHWQCCNELLSRYKKVREFWWKGWLIRWEKLICQCANDGNSTFFEGTYSSNFLLLYLSILYVSPPFPTFFVIWDGEVLCVPFQHLAWNESHQLNFYWVNRL